ncbi:MAG: hypothetical protein ACRD43_08805 [Pyrinomonadaceae bacterium]
MRLSVEQYRKLSSTTRRTPKKHGEADAQAAYFEILRSYEGMYPILRWVQASMNGANRGKPSAGQSWAQGQKPGVWDVFIPVARHGFGGAWIENKFGDNKLTAAQAEFGEFVRSQNFSTKISYDLETSLKFTEFYLGVDLHGPIAIGRGK